MAEIEAWHRRHALQIAAALPETVEDALLVLRIVIEIVTPAMGFVPAPDQPVRDLVLGNVISLSSATNGSSR